VILAGGPLSAEPGNDGRPRLFCFHHAGGAASAFHGLRRALAPAIDVVPVQLPGRERRVREAPFTAMAPLLDHLAEHLGPYLRGPYAFYGHSMGALVAHGLACGPRRHGAVPPSALLVGACPPPDAPSAVMAVAMLPDDRLTRWMVDLGGMSEQLLGHPDWRRAATALLRADLRACVDREPPAGPPLSCPVHVFAGTDDPLVSPAEAAGWARHTTAEFRLHTVPGGHLFPIASSGPFRERLSPVLSRVLPLRLLSGNLL
jgi:surfactin synthase thioesterase subunit